MALLQYKSSSCVSFVCLVLAAFFVVPSPPAHAQGYPGATGWVALPSQSGDYDWGRLTFTSDWINYDGSTGGPGASYKGGAISMA